MKKHFLLSLIAICVAATFGYAQRAPQPATAHEDGLDPTPVDPATDPNVDLYINNWKNAPPRSMYGHLVFHDILTPLEGPDRLHPAKRGAVLEEVGGVSYATLQPGAVATGKWRPVWYCIDAGR